MHLHTTINGPIMAPESPERAREQGQLGYMQWLGSMPGNAPYKDEAIYACIAAMDLERSKPAVAVFCELIRASLSKPLRRLDLALPRPRRRGGAAVRRSRL
ncbi:hypothetical protein [Rhodovulum sulfidophilum]|uniref:hypothetical protein n=1 Tax=Rhodovulum sulfidophilum TaxID=35806 RepID=UPI001F38AB01|nr:hypothetical protein [Rhodovulum sulfidophilum]MCE8441626.1 hypothetical protein [Rhodovulum sulfidophilum]